MSTILKALQDEGGGGGERKGGEGNEYYGRKRAGRPFFTDNVLKMPNINPAL